MIVNGTKLSACGNTQHLVPSEEIRQYLKPEEYKRLQALYFLRAVEEEGTHEFVIEELAMRPKRKDRIPKAIPFRRIARILESQEGEGARRSVVALGRGRTGNP